jgi:hypothetical protein
VSDGCVWYFAYGSNMGLTVETFETAGGLVTRNVVYWSAEEVAARFRPI